MARGNQTAREAAAEAAGNMADEAGNAGADILSMTARMAERSAERFSGLFGGEDAEATAQRYARSTEVLQDCGRAVAEGYQELSREYLNWARGQFQSNLTAFGKLAQCRSPQELIAAQNQLFGENVALALSANRRFAEISKEIADRAAEKITALADQGTPTGRAG
jgi:hypothetical protein